MSNKSKGSNAERELVKIFTEQGWRALRVAGSGVNDDSPCDIIVGKVGKKGYAIEAKSSKKNRIYITKEQIEDFVKFSLMLGLTPVLAIRFNYKGWVFLNPQHIEDTGKYWVVSLERTETHGLRFSQFFEESH
ncbi:MAG: Holliday junction resolvase Hjc [Nanoarchaeota archaeon]